MTTITTPVEERKENWHLMGGAYDLSGCKTVDEALVRADLDWEVGLYDMTAKVADGEVKVPDQYAVIRDSDLSVLGVVGARYQPVQNRDLAEFGRAIRDEAEVDWSVGGHFKGGARTFLSFTVPSGIQVANQDEIESIIMVTNGHDGGASLRAQVIANRIACSNQVNAFIRDAKFAISIRHTGSVEAKVEEARRALGMTATYMERFAEIANTLADIDIDLVFYEDFVDELIPIDADAGVRAKAARERQRALLRRNWDDTETIDPGLKQTGWGALNLVAEMIDHGNLDIRKSKQDIGERRFLSSLEGTGARLRERAYDLLLGEADEIKARGEERRALASV